MSALLKFDLRKRIFVHFTIQFNPPKIEQIIITVK